MRRYSRNMEKALWAWLTICPALMAQGEEQPVFPIGSWHGKLDAGIAKLQLVVNIEGAVGALKATLDSPDQGAAGIAIDDITFENGVLKFAIARLRASYKGTFDAEQDLFVGVFTQGQPMSLDLARSSGAIEPPKRPQIPRGPLPYDVEEVFYSHDPKADTNESFRVARQSDQTSGRVRLAATLTMPRSEGPHPAVVLISGSGPQDRDESLMGHKPFLVIADSLTRSGIAVLRFDDRGTAMSTGDHGTATSHDFARDAHAGLLYLKTRQEIDSSKIGLMGHSEGGLIAPIVAAHTKDVAFIVMLAGPGVDGEQVICLQSRVIGKAMGVSDDVIDSGEKTNRAIFAAMRECASFEEARPKVRAELEAAYEDLSVDEKKQVGSKRQFVESKEASLASPWMRSFLQYDPAPTLAKVMCPVLALNGSLDLQVVPSQNIPPIKQALRNNPDAQVIELKGLNHLFQNAETGRIDEYVQIEETFDPKALRLICDWIAKRFL